MERDETTRRLRGADCLRQYFQATGREYATGKNIRCPDAAAHAHGDKNPSAHIYENADGALVKCYGCGGSWDIFSLWQMDNGGDFKDAKRALCQLCGIDGATAKPTATPKPPATAAERDETGENGETDEKKPTKPDKATEEHITQCAFNFQAGADGEAGRAYLAGRGISLETARRFGIGYDPKRQAVIIPQGTGYAARSIDPNAAQNFKIRYYPTGTPRVLFNGDGLRNAAADGTPVFIVEGEIDALSIAEGGGVAVSCGGTGGIGKAVAAATRAGRGVYIPLMDRDEAGDKAQADLERRLAATSGVVVFKGAREIVLTDLPDGTHPKDANDALCADAAGFRARVAEAIARARAYASPFNKERNGMLRRRLCDIPPPKDENTDPDALIKNYALAKGEGWIFAGEPGAGKSSFLLQFAIFAGAGKTCFGFEFTRPLRVFYLQTELQMRKLKQSVNSLQYAALAEWKWTDEEFRNAVENVSFDEYMIGNVCDKLPDYLIKAFSSYPFDLLILDPLLTFARDDLTLQKVAYEFFYDKINAVMGGRKHSTPDGTPVKFASIIAHHTGKPRTDGGKKVERGQFSTAGSFAINAWARFQMNLSRYAGDVYELLAAKNPECANWTDENGAYVESIYIKRASRGDRYWTLATKEEAEAAKDGATQKPTETDEQRKERENRETRRAIELIANRLQFGEPLTKSQIYEFCKKNTDPVFKGFNSYSVKSCATYGIKKPCNLAYDLIIENPLAYGVMSRSEQRPNGKFVTTYGGGAIPLELKQAATSAAASVAPLRANEPEPPEDEADEDGDE